MLIRHRVIATDLIDYRSPYQDHAGRDFLLERRAPDGVEMIVTNPPFKLAAQFASHALALCPRVAMLAAPLARRCLANHHSFPLKGDSR